MASTAVWAPIGANGLFSVTIGGGSAVVVIAGLLSAGAIAFICQRVDNDIDVPIECTTKFFGGSVGSRGLRS
jgi:hypothetical protein